jgi:hypothetical protein
MSLILAFHLNNIREFVEYKTLAVSIRGWYLVTSMHAISDIFDKTSQYLKVCKGNNTYTKFVLCPLFMMN